MSTTWPSLRSRPTGILMLGNVSVYRRTKTNGAHTRAEADTGAAHGGQEASAAETDRMDNALACISQPDSALRCRHGNHTIDIDLAAHRRRAPGDPHVAPVIALPRPGYGHVLVCRAVCPIEMNGPML